MPYLKKSDRLVCFVFLDSVSASVCGTSTLFHVTSDKSNIFLKELEVQAQSQHNDCLLLLLLD